MSKPDTVRGKKQGDWKQVSVSVQWMYVELPKSTRMHGDLETRWTETIQIKVSGVMHDKRCYQAHDTSHQPHDPNISTLIWCCFCFISLSFLLWFVFIFVFFYLCLHLSLCIVVYVCVLVYVALCLCVFSSWLCVHSSDYVILCAFVCLFVCVCLYLFICKIHKLLEW